jgi:ribosomal protein S14
MKAKLYRNITKFGAYTNSLYINIYTYKILRKTSFLSNSDRAIFSFFIKSRHSHLCSFKNHCFITSRSRSVYSDFFMSRFELKRYSMFGNIVGIKVASWLFFYFYV